VEEYARRLRDVGPSGREALLRAESRLPGPRGNLELLAAVVEVAGDDELRHWASLGAADAPGNTPGEFLATVGAAGLGRLVVDGATGELDTLRRLAGDPRWRIREGVAMALQRIGSADMDALLVIARGWATGSRYEQRAAVAGLAEPVLLGDQGVMSDALDVFDAITASIVGAEDTRTGGFVALAKALGYGWSVLVAAGPDIGKPRMERWLASGDASVRRIMGENLSKARLERMDADWTARSRARLA